MKNLRDIIMRYPYLLDIPYPLLECIDFREDRLISQEKDFTFVDSESLIDEFINKIKLDKFVFQFREREIQISYKSNFIKVVDNYNDYKVRFSVNNKVRILCELLYYFISMEEHSEYQKDFMLSVNTYEKLKEGLSL